MEQLLTIFFPKQKVEGSSCSQEDHKENIVSHYKEKNLNTFKSSHDLYPRVRGKDIRNPIMVYSIDVKDNTFNLVVVEPKFKQPKYTKYFKAPQIQIKIDNVDVVDKIKLHKNTREMIFTDLLQSKINNTKLHENLEEVKKQLSQ